MQLLCISVKVCDVCHYMVCDVSCIFDGHAHSGTVSSGGHVHAAESAQVEPVIQTTNTRISKRDSNL